jgi:hypothetical protein
MSPRCKLEGRIQAHSVFESNEPRRQLNKFNIPLPACSRLGLNRAKLVEIANRSGATIVPMPT